MKLAQSLQKTRWPLFGFILAYLVLSGLTYRDYGITWDEPDWYGSGEIMMAHYKHQNTNDDTRIFSIEQASHNYLYPAVLKCISPSGSIKTDHFLNMVFALLGYVAIFEMLFFAYGDSWWALGGALFLLLTLRYSGDVPGNPKDMPFAVLYLSGLSLIYFFRSRWKDERMEALVLGSVIGIATCVRGIGITLLPIWAFYRLIEFDEDKKSGWFSKIRSWISKEAINVVLLFLVSQFWMMSCWPYLGSNYFGNYINIFKSTQKYTWDGPILFMGQEVLTHNLPLSYLPVWIAITAPVFLLVFFLYSLIRSKATTPAKKLYLLLGIGLFLQLGLYFLLRPVIYNGLRHYLFLMPLICLMGTIGLIEFVRSGAGLWVKRTVLTLVVVNLILILFQWIQLYPYQYIYFNELVGGLKGANGKFETDYWGASLKESAQWLAANYSDKEYRVKTCAESSQETNYFKGNMVGSDDMKDADFEIELNQPRDFVLDDQKKAKIIYTAQREGVPLNYVMRLKP